MVQVSISLVLIVVVLWCGVANAQHHDDPVATRDRGIELYNQGKSDEAVKVLQAFVKQYKLDSRGWHYLGLAYGVLGKKDEARDAHQASVQTAIQFTQDYFSNADPALVCVMVRPTSRMLTESADSAEEYLKLSEKPSKAKVDEWPARASQLRQYLKTCSIASNGGDKIAREVEMEDLQGSKRVSTRARIISRPHTRYTEEARRNRTSGTVVLFVMLAEDGTVKAVVPNVSLPDGLTGEATKAAKQIKFTPATVNGKPVSTFMRVEYSFSTY